MRARTWMLAALLLASVCAQAATCNSGDCQTGTVAGPFTAAQVAEYSSANQFPVCTSSGCTTVRNWANGVEGIDAK